MAVPAAPLIGRRVNNYELKRLLGEGGTGMVYEAEHLVLRRRAAVKVLKPQYASNEDLVQRFINEARAATAIGHPNIIDIIDVGLMPEGEPYMMMEFLDGETLSARILRQGRLSPSEAMKHARQTASALAAAHAHGIVHRDLKPDNLFIVPDVRNPGQEYIKVLDFGIAKLRAEFAPGLPGTRTGAVFGTPAYMSPEQCLGKVKEIDHRSDVYSLGIILYEMLCGHPPFQGNDQELYFKHVDESPKSPCSVVQEISVHLESVVLKALEKKAAVRIQTMDEFIALLEERTPIPTVLCEELTGRTVANQTPKVEATPLPPEPATPVPIAVSPKPVRVPTEIDFEQAARNMAAAARPAPFRWTPARMSGEADTQPVPRSPAVEESMPAPRARSTANRARSGSVRAPTQTTLSSALGQAQDGQTNEPGEVRGWYKALAFSGAFVACCLAVGLWLSYRESPSAEFPKSLQRAFPPPGAAGGEARPLSQPAAAIPVETGPALPVAKPVPAATLKETPVVEKKAEPVPARKEPARRRRHQAALPAETGPPAPVTRALKAAAAEAAKPAPATPAGAKKRIRQFDPDNPYAR